MMGTTHAAIGALVGLVAASQINSEPSSAIALGVLGAFIALLPDIDHPNSKIRQRTGWIGHAALFWLPHRGITHTLWAVLLVGLIAYVLLPVPLAIVITAAYASHIIADAMTPSGIRLLMPMKWKLRSPLPIRTGGAVEWLFSLGVMVTIGILWSRMY